MSEETDETEDAESEQTFGIQLEPADEFMYDELVHRFGAEFIAADVREVAKQRLRQLYDNQDAVEQQVAQARQQAALAGQQ